jgi:amino acid transporter
MVAGALYTMLQIACVRALPQLAQSAFPLAAAGEVYGGPALGSLLRVGTTVSAVGIAFGMITMTPHFLAALARVSDLGWGLDRSSGTGTPTRALAVTMALVSALVCLGDLGELFTLSSIAVVTQYGVAALALVVLAFRKERGLGLRHAWSALPTLAIVVALLSGATAREWAVAAATCAIGFGVKLARTCFARAPRAS